jgi:hypothetical protein
MLKTNKQRFSLSRQTLRELSGVALRRAIGAMPPTIGSDADCAPITTTTGGDGGATHTGDTFSCLTMYCYP